MRGKLLNRIGLAILITLPLSSIGFGSSTNDVWNHHIQAWEDRSLEGIVSDYSDDSTLILNNQIFRGRKQIAYVFTQLFEIFDVGVNRIDKPIVFDRFVYITWNYSPKGRQEFFGTDTIVIEDAKIVLQTIASPLYNVFPLYSAQSLKANWHSTSRLGKGHLLP